MFFDYYRNMYPYNQTPGGMFPVPGRMSPMPSEPVYPTPGRISPGPGGVSPSQSSGAPTSPPPQQIPNKPQRPGGFAYMIDSNVLQPCLYRNTYVWLTDGSSFWFYPVALGANSVGGYYWDWSTSHWNYYALDTKYIDIVNCMI